MVVAEAFSLHFSLRFSLNQASLSVPGRLRQISNPDNDEYRPMSTMAEGEYRPRSRLQLSPVDRFGRTIDPAVLQAAEELGHGVIEYGERAVGDPAVLANLLEESAAAVSRVLRTQQQGNGTPIRDLRAYLFTALIRRVNRIARRRLASGNSPYPPSMGMPATEDLDRKILIEEFLRRCDPVTREMFYRRIEGFSWKEIGKKYGVSAHAAESRFGQALQRVRKRLGFRD